MNANTLTFGTYEARSQIELDLDHYQTNIFVPSYFPLFYFYHSFMLFNAGC